MGLPSSNPSWQQWKTLYKSRFNGKGFSSKPCLMTGEYDQLRGHWVTSVSVLPWTSLQLSCLLEHGLPQDFCPSNWLLHTMHCGWTKQQLRSALDLYGSYDKMKLSDSDPYDKWSNSINKCFHNLDFSSIGSESATNLWDCHSKAGDSDSLGQGEQVQMVHRKKKNSFGGLLLTSLLERKPKHIKTGGWATPLKNMRSSIGMMT